MTQLGLSFDVGSVALERWTRPPCFYGESGIGWPWIGQAHCHRCLLYVVASIGQFWADVRAGKYDAEGYTPKERKAHAKRQS